MAVAYTNRKGVTYYLHRAVTRSGAPRYFFAREPGPGPQGEPVEEVPPGYQIVESVNGVVSLARERPAEILPEEVELVEAAIRRHPKAGNYRVSVRGRRIVVHERVGPDAEELAAQLGGLGFGVRTLAERLRERVEADLDRHAQFAPVLRFTLLTPRSMAGVESAGERRFGVERWCYLGRIDGWLDLYREEPLEALVRDTVPTLGTDAFYELH